MTTLRISALAVALGLVAACADGPSGPAGPIAVSSVVVQADTTALIIGATRRLIATVHAADGSVLSGRSVAWTAGDTTIAAVAQDGTVTARGAGTVTIRAASEGRSGEATLRIVPAARVVARVEIVPGGQLTTRVGNVHQLAVRAFGDDGSEITGHPVTWTTSDAAIASVEPTGRLFGRGIGRAAVTATVDGRAATLVVEVGSQVVRVDVDPDSAVVGVGEVFRIYGVPRDEDGNIPNLPGVWSTSDSAVATVVAPGRVTGRAPGKTTVTVTVGGTVGRATIVVAEWIDRRLLALNDSAPPATLHVYTSPDGTGVLRTTRVVAQAGTLRVLPAGPTSGRYEQRFDVTTLREGSPASFGVYITSGSYTRDPATGDLRFHEASGRELTGVRLPDGRVAITGRLEVAEDVVTPVTTFLYASQ